MIFFKPFSCTSKRKVFLCTMYGFPCPKRRRTYETDNEAGLASDSSEVTASCTPASQGALSPTFQSLPTLYASCSNPLCPLTPTASSPSQTKVQDRTIRSAKPGVCLFGASCPNYLQFRTTRKTQTRVTIRPDLYVVPTNIATKTKIANKSNRQIKTTHKDTYNKVVKEEIEVRDEALSESGYDTAIGVATKDDYVTLRDFLASSAYHASSSSEDELLTLHSHQDRHLTATHLDTQRCCEKCGRWNLAEKGYCCNQCDRIYCKECVDIRLNKNQVRCHCMDAPIGNASGNCEKSLLPREERNKTSKNLRDNPSDYSGHDKYNDKDSSASYGLTEAIAYDKHLEELEETYEVQEKYDEEVAAFTRAEIKAMDNERFSLQNNVNSD